MARIFYSQAREADKAFARRLHADLTSTGFTAGSDRVCLPSRQLAFYQEIRAAIAAWDRLVPGLARLAL
jgi:hypothetical protein